MVITGFPLPLKVLKHRVKHKVRGAARALWVPARWAGGNSVSLLQIPVIGFIARLRSGAWSNSAVARRVLWNQLPELGKD